MSPDRRRVVGLSVAALLFGACGTETALPKPPTIVDVSMNEFNFTVRPTAPRGRAVFQVSNRGRLDHQLTLEKLPDDFPPIGKQLQSSVRRAAPTVAVMPMRAPGETASFAVDLKPGRYAMVSFLTDADGVNQALKGMSAEIRVR